MVGMYGSRLELEVAHSTSSFEVNGTLALGMAQDLDENLFRSDDFEFEMDGSVVIRYDEELVNAAIEDLADLEVQTGAAASGSGAGYSFSVVGGSSGGVNGVDAHSSMKERLLSGDSVDLDVDAITPSTNSQSSTYGTVQTSP